MTDRNNLSKQVRIDETGRVKLSDEDLENLLSASDMITAGGDGSVNNGCTNSGDCSGTLNTAACTNTTACAGSLNSAGQCKMPREMEG